jgi:hypothetical protein
MPGFPVFFLKVYMFREQELINRDGKTSSCLTTDENIGEENPQQSKE